MRKLTKITNSPNQQVTYVYDNQNIILHLYFKPTQMSWFLDVISDKLTVYGQRVSACLNLLNKYHNIINCGIAISTSDNLDPYTVDDFINGHASFYMLNSTDVRFMEFVYNGKI